MKKIICSIILALTIFMITGCQNNLQYEGKDKEDSKKREVVKKEPEKKDLTEDEKNKLLSLIEKYKTLEFAGESFKSSKLDNQKVLDFVFSLDTTGEFKFETLAKYAKDYLGYDLKAEDYLCFMDHGEEAKKDKSAYLYLYDKEKNKYIYNENHPGHGAGGVASNIYNRYQSSYSIEDEYYITVYKAFSDIMSDVIDSETTNYYATYNNAQSSKNSIFEIELDFNTYKPKENPVNILNKISEEKLVPYTYKFILKDDNFVLEEYKIGE